MKYDNGSTESSQFLGMPKGAMWVLYGGDQVDLTDGMRDYVTYNLARATGDYATRRDGGPACACMLGIREGEGLFE